MIHDDAKQVVILKNIKSKYIEEAIIILKSKHQLIGKKQGEKTMIHDFKNNNDIVKEAQSIIDQYIDQQSSKYHFFSKEQKNNGLRKWNISVGFILNIALFISISLFIYLLSRAI